MEKDPPSIVYEPIVFSDDSNPKNLKRSNIRREPWRHSVSTPGLHHSSSTAREFKPYRQRQGLLFTSLVQCLTTLILCTAMVACLYGFSKLQLMTVPQVKIFNALIIIISICLGANLTSSLREFALMLRWRLLASKHRSLHEFDLLMQCESLRKVIELMGHARRPNSVLPTQTQCLCAVWILVNVAMQVLVALLGLTYNLETASVPERRLGEISIVDLHIIRDIWGVTNPTFSAQLGTANSYGIQGQDFLYPDFGAQIPGQGKTPSWGLSSSPTIYATNANYSEFKYVFHDQNIRRPDLTILSHRYVTVHAACTQLALLSGGNGVNTTIVYQDTLTANPITLDVIRVGPGAVTYISALNSTCGPRCASIFVLQSADNETIPHPSFFTCNNTLSSVTVPNSYVTPLANSNVTADIYAMPDTQAFILAGAIGWTGFNHTVGDQYQYVRYSIESWWSPDKPTTAYHIAGRIMEFSIEAVAAMDYNGPRFVVPGYYPVPAQAVSVQWWWAGAMIAVIPAVQFLLMLAVVRWANKVVIKDESSLSVAKLLGEVVGRLEGGSLLTGKEIAAELSAVRVRYEEVVPGESGEQEDDQVSKGLRFENQIQDGVIRRVGVMEEGERSEESAHRRKGARMRAGIYD